MVIRACNDSEATPKPDRIASSASARRPHLGKCWGQEGGKKVSPSNVACTCTYDGPISATRRHCRAEDMRHRDNQDRAKPISIPVNMPQSRANATLRYQNSTEHGHSIIPPVMAPTLVR
jgi:hypothetical protein